MFCVNFIQFCANCFTLRHNYYYYYFVKWYGYMITMITTDLLSSCVVVYFGHGAK